MKKWAPAATAGAGLFVLATSVAFFSMFAAVVTIGGLLVLAGGALAWGAGGDA